MDLSSTIIFLTLLVCFVSIILSTYLLVVSSSNRLSNILFAAFILITTIDISVYFYSEYISVPLSFEMIRIRSSAFKSPLLFLYSLSIIFKNFRLRKIHLLHALPFIIYVAILFPSFFLLPSNEQELFFNAYPDQIEIKFIWASTNIISYLYLAGMLYYLWKYKKILYENYTNYEAIENYRWLKHLIIFVLVLSLITTLKDAIKYVPGLKFLNLNIFRNLVLTAGLIFYCWLVFKALLSPKHFRGVDSDYQLIDNLDDYKKVSENKIAKQIKLVKDYMIKVRPYLNSSLTIDTLAKALDMPTKELSLLINKQLNRHFFEFVNQYRLEDAKELLADPTKKHLNIQEIYYKVGFNSKAPFNTAFKKYTGLTPSRYREKHLKSIPFRKQNP